MCPYERKKMNGRIMASVTIGCIFFALQAMEGDSLDKRAKSHVDILFSCYPIFEIAVDESEEVFWGILMKFIAH